MNRKQAKNEVYEHTGVHRFLNTLDTNHSNIHQQQTGWNTPQGFMIYLSTNFETRYLLSSCSNQSIDKNFRFSTKFMLKVASSVGLIRLRIIPFFGEILFIYNYLGLKRTLALQGRKLKQILNYAELKKLDRLNFTKKNQYFYLSVQLILCIEIVAFFHLFRRISTIVFFDITF